MAFKDRIKELMSSHLEAELMEGLKHDRYMRAHGKKASGTGTWMFTTKKDGEVNYDNDKEVFQSGPSMRLGDAAKEAMKALGKTVYVMEAKLDPVGQEDDDVDNDGDVDSSDKYLKKRRDAIKKAIGTKPKLREQAKKQKAKMMPVKGSVDDANDVAQKATGESVKEDDDTARMYKDNPEMMNSKGPGGMKSLTKRAQKAVKKKMDEDYNKAPYSKGHPFDRAEHHEDQARDHEMQAEKHAKNGDKMAASVHRAAMRAHEKAANYFGKVHDKRERGIQAPAGSATSQAAHKATQKANQYNESVELVEYSEGAMVKDMVKLNASSCGKTEMYEKMKEKYGVDKATFEGLYASHCMKNESVELTEMEDHGRFAFDMKSKEHMNSAKSDLKAAGLSGRNRPGHTGGDHVLHVKGSAKDIHKVMKKHADNMHDANMGSHQSMNDDTYGHRLTNESVEDIAEGTMMSAAKELEAYARKNGGIDKNDFMKAVVMMKKGQKPQLMKFVDGLDTEPREKILTVLDDHGQLKEEVDAETVMMENLADAIENTDLSKLTVEELQEIEEGIIKALGVATGKVASGVGKAVVGTAKLAGRAAKASVINKHGNVRFTKNAKIDRQTDAANKVADKMQKRKDAEDRLKAAQDRVKSFAKPANKASQIPVRKPLKASYAEAFETPSNEKKLADLGRKMMDMGKKEKNDLLANAYARLGDALTRYGTTFGARNMKELEKKTGMKPAIIADLMKRAAKHK
jgi:hypothetical protein